jgi:hypothetical protein
MRLLQEKTRERFPELLTAVHADEIKAYAPGRYNKPIPGNPSDRSRLPRGICCGDNQLEFFGSDLDAWLDKHFPRVKFRFSQVGAGDTVKSKAGRKPGKQPERMKQILDALEKWAVNDGISFDRQAMPGQVGKGPTDDGSFHWFCASLPKPFKADFQKGPRAFENYRAGLCVFPPWAKPSDFYRNALPHIAQSLQSVASDSVSPRKVRKAR